MTLGCGDSVYLGLCFSEGVSVGFVFVVDIENVVRLSWVLFVR